ncbi:hypothetical protein Ocin01_06947 [Orchesella cincta]|uniref:Protein quiver n=1 Tax=Orchesella cincta TaxID=48709 RepID=A0A1D2N3E0_ORCCI|nr:hypothetical protein Ocin01_06947 [Orchesella cincta]
MCLLTLTLTVSILLAPCPTNALQCWQCSVVGDLGWVSDCETGKHGTSIECIGSNSYCIIARVTTSTHKMFIKDCGNAIGDAQIWCESNYTSGLDAHMETCFCNGTNNCNRFEHNIKTTGQAYSTFMSSSPEGNAYNDGTGLSPMTITLAVMILLGILWKLMWSTQ